MKALATQSSYVRAALVVTDSTCKMGSDGSKGSNEKPQRDADESQPLAADRPPGAARVRDAAAPSARLDRGARGRA